MTDTIDSTNLASSMARFFARNVDLYIGIFICGILGELVLAKHATWYVKLMTTPNNSILIGFLFLPFALTLDAVICHFLGTNFGKYILGLHVKKIDGSKPTLAEWFRRAFGVWKSGYAFGFPLFNLWTMNKQRNLLDEKKPTSYDGNLGFQVFGDKLTTYKKVRAIVLVITVYALVMYLQMLSQQFDKKIEEVITAPPYSWQNPITRNNALIKSEWKFEDTKNDQGQNVYTFNEVTDHAVVVFAMESTTLTINNYITAYQKNTSQFMTFNDGGSFSEERGINTWVGVGTMKSVPDSMLRVEVRQNGNQFWRIVTIQTKPYDFTQKLIEALKQELWETVRFKEDKVHS